MAKRGLAAGYRQQKNGLFVDNRNITLDQYYEEWKSARDGTIKGNTVLNIECRYRNHIGPAMGHRMVADIGERAVARLQKELAAKQKPSTVNITIVQLKNIFDSAVADGIIARNPAAGVKPLKADVKAASKTFHRALTEEEQRLFMEHVKKEWLYELIALLLCTGMRVGEATALTWNDIDYVNNVIHITKTVSRTASGEYTVGTLRSRTSIRDIPLNDTIRKILKGQKEKLDYIHGNIVNLSRSVFENVYGGMVYNASVNKAISDTLRRIRQEGEVIEHFSAHALRDTFATRYIEQGGNPQVLRTILGHAKKKDNAL